MLSVTPHGSLLQDFDILFEMQSTALGLEGMGLQWLILYGSQDCHLYILFTA